MKSKKQIETFLFSVVGVAAMFLIAVAVYVIAGFAKVRADLTEDNLWTLSTGSKNILKKLDTPVEIRFYYSQSTKAMPAPVKVFAQRVEDLLNEYEKASNGMVEVRKYDPEPASDAEDLAKLDGVDGQMTQFGERIYLGLAVGMLDSKVAIPFLSPAREQNLEYEITQAISRVTVTEQPVVGILSSLPVFGQPANPMMMQMGQRGQEPWIFISELRNSFEVEQVQTSTEAIPDNIDVLILVHPKNLSPQTQFAIDQFVMRGGKLLVFVDPFSLADAQTSTQPNPMQAATTSGSDLPQLFSAWGVAFDQSKVAADLKFQSRIQMNQQGQQQSAPAILSITAEGRDPDDVLTSQIDSLVLPFPGALTGSAKEGLERKVLLHTTENSQLVDRFMAQFSSEQIAKEFEPSGDKLALAVRLSGKFTTAFPDGKPPKAAADDEESGEPPRQAEALKESKETVVIVVADADMLFDIFTVRVQQIFGQRIMMPLNENLVLLQNMVEQLGGDTDLISIRSKGAMNRPFTVVRDMRLKAEEGYRSKIAELENTLQEAQTRLNELQAQKQGDQKMLLSNEQRQEIERFKQREAETQRELNQLEKDLRRDVDRLENELKWVNIAGMPVLVTLFGLGLAMIKKKRTSAK